MVYLIQVYLLFEVLLFHMVRLFVSHDTNGMNKSTKGIEMFNKTNKSTVLLKRNTFIWCCSIIRDFETYIGTVPRELHIMV